MQDYEALLIFQAFAIAFEVFFSFLDIFVIKIRGCTFYEQAKFDIFAIVWLWAGSKCEEHDEIYNYCRDLFKAVEPSPLKYGNHMNSVINFYRDRFQVSSV